MSVIRIEKVLEEVNAGVSGDDLARALEYHPEKIQVNGNTIKCFCPLHREQAFRSLLIDIKNKNYRCSMKHCRGFNGGTYVELWAEHKGLEPLEAALDLAEKLKLNIDVAALRSLGTETIAKARKAIGEGNLDQARQCAEQAAAFMPRDPEAARILAEIHRAAGDDDRADEQWLKVADLATDAKQYDEARKVLISLAADRPARIEVAQRMASLARAEGDPNALIEALLGLAAVYGDKGDDKAQIKTLAELEELAGDDARALESIAGLHEKARRSAQALETLQKLSSIYELEAQWEDLYRILKRRKRFEPDSLDLREQTAVALLRLGHQAEAAEEFLALAALHKQGGDLEKERRLLDQLLAAAPDHVPALERLARLEADSAQAARAIDLYRRLATLARKEGQADRAAAYLTQAKGIDPEDYGLRYDLAEARLAQNDSAQGIAELFELANLLLNESDPKRGFEVLDRIASLIGDNVERRIEIGRCLEAAGHDERALTGYLDFVRRALKDSKPEAALAVLDEARRLAPRDEKILELRVDCCLGLGRKPAAVDACRDGAKAFLAIGDYDRAEALLQRGIKIDRAEPGAKADLAQLFELMGRIDDAVQLWIEVALFHRSSEHRDKSLQAAREALRLNPKNAEAKGLVAEALEAQGQIREALDLWKQAAEELRSRKEASPEALKMLEHALTLAPGDLAMLEGVARLKREIESAAAARPAFEAWIAAAEKAGAGGALLAALDEASKAFPKDLAWRRRLAQALIEEDRPDDACPHLEALLKTYRKSGKQDAAYRETLELVTRIKPEELGLRMELAEAMAAAGEMAESHALFAEITRLHLARGDQEGGIEVLRRSLEHAPENRDGLARLAELLEHNGRAKEAIAAYERLSELNRKLAGTARANLPVIEKLILLCPDRMDLRLELGQTYEATGRPQEAVEQYYRIAQAEAAKTPKADGTLGLCRRIVDLVPEFMAGRELLVRCHIERGEIGPAKKELDEMAEIALRDGDLAQAEGIFKRIQKIDPQDIGSGERLGRLYEAKGNVEKAAAEYRKVLALYRQRTDASRTVSVLRKMKGLLPADAEIRTDLARTLTAMKGHETEAGDEWYDLIALAINGRNLKAAHAAAKEAAPIFAEQWERRLRVAGLFAEALPPAEALEGWKTLARAAREAAREEICLEAAGKGLAAAPADVDLRELRVAAYRAQQDWANAEADLRALADQHTAAGKHAAAESYLARAIELNPKSTELLGLLADAQLAQHRNDEAALTLRHLADQHREDGDLDSAIARARQISGLDPKNLESRDYLADLLIAAEEIDEAMEVWREIGSALVKMGDRPSALLRFQGVLAHRPRDRAALRRVAELTLETSGIGGALAAYDRLLTVAIEDAPADETEAEFERIRTAHPGELSLSERFAAFLAQTGRKPRAIEVLRETAAAYRGDRSDLESALRVTREVRALAPQNLEVMEEEAALLEQLERGPEAVGVLRELAEASIKQGEDEKAAGALGRAADLLGDVAPAQVAAAEAWALVENAEKATRYFLRAIEIHDRASHLEPCIPLLKRAIALNPARLELVQALAQTLEQTDQNDLAAEQWLLLGEKHEAEGRAPEAAEVYRRVKALAPMDMEPRRRLARLAEAGGDRVAAIDELRELAPLAGEHGDREQKIAVLRRIRELDPEDAASLADLAHEFRALGREPELFDSLSELERIWRERGNLERAAEILEELKALRPGDLGLVARTFEALVLAGQQVRAAKIGIELIQTRLSRGEAKEAGAMIRKVIEIDPANVDRRLTLIQLANDQGEEDLALGELRLGAEELTKLGLGQERLQLCQAGLEIFPNDPELRLAEIAALHAAGQSERAIARHIELARAHEKAGRADAAAETLQAILAEHPDDEATHEAVVALAQKRGDAEAAVESLVRLAEIHYVAGSIEKSIEALERLLKISPAQSELRCRLAELYMEAGDARRAHGVWLAAAEELRAAGNLPRAIEIHERMKELYPGDSGVIERLAEEYWESGAEQPYLIHALELARIVEESGLAEESIDILERAAERCPKNLELWERLAQIQSRGKRKSEAVRPLLKLYEIHEAARRLDKARVAVERAIELDADDPALMQTLGDLCLRMGQKVEGLKRLTEAAARMREMKRFAEAQTVLERVLKADPTNLETRRAQGELAEASDDPQAAAQHYAAAARGWLEKRDHAQAIALFERLLGLDPNLIEEREAYAHALEREGRQAEAGEQYLKLIESLGAEADPRQVIRYSRQILKENPDHAPAHEHLFRVYERTEKPRLAFKECEWLAEHFQAAGELSKAETYIRRGLELAPEEIELRKKWIELLIESGRFEEAGTNLGELSEIARSRADARTSRWALARACDVMPNNIEFRLKLAEQQDQAGETEESRKTRLATIGLYLERGMMEEGRVLAERVMEPAPDNVELRRQVAEIFEKAGLPEVAAYHMTILARAALKDGRAETARQLAQQILKIKPRHVAARECLMEISRAAGRSAEASEQAREIYKIYLEDGDLPSAQRALAFVIEERPSDPEPRRLMVALLGQLGDNAGMVEQLRRLSEIQVNGGHVNEAIDSLKLLMRERPDDTRARARYIDLYAQVGEEGDLVEDYLKLAEIFRRKNSIVEATRIYEKLIALDPKQARPREAFIDFLFGLGQVHRGVAESRELAALYLEGERKNEAGKALDRALAAAPDDVELRHQLARLQLRTNRRGLALETLRGLLKSYETAGDRDREIETLEQMLEIDTMNVELRQRLADLYTRAGNAEKAKPQRMALAEQYLSRQLYDLAEREYRRILDLSPGDAEIWQRVIETHLHIGSSAEVVPDMVALANVYSAAGRLKDAVGMYRQILDAEPDNVEILFKYIESYVQIGLEQDLVDTYLHLAALLSRSGDVEGALKLYNQLREIDPGNPEIERRLRETGARFEEPPPRAGKAKRDPLAAAGPGRDLADFVESVERVSEDDAARTEKAIRNFENILKLNPENPGVRAKLADLLDKVGRGDEAEKHWVTSAEDFLARGDSERSVAILNELLRRHPEKTDLRERLEKASLRRESLKTIEGVLKDSDLD